MANNCKILYLDENGAESQVYIDNLKHGEKQAKQAYLKSMSGFVSTRFQRGPADSYYTHTPESDDAAITALKGTYRGMNAGGITKAIAKIKGEEGFNSSEIAEKQVKSMEVQARLLEMDASSLNSMARASIKAKVETYFKDNPEELLRRAEKKIVHYEQQRIYGSIEHGVIERYVKLRNDYLEKTGDTSNKLPTTVHKLLREYAYKSFFAELPKKHNEITGKFEYDNNQVGDINKNVKIPDIYLEEVKDKAWQKRTSDYATSLNYEYLSSDASLAFNRSLKTFETYLSSFGADAKIFTEIHLGDEDLGVRAIADLVIRKANGNLVPIDYKTKTIREEDEALGGKTPYEKFRSVNFGRLEAIPGVSSAFAGQYKNGETAVNIQLTAIRHILEKNGFKGRVESPVALIITGMFTERADPTAPGAYTDYTITPHTVSTLDREFKNYVRDTTGYVEEEVTVSGLDGAITAVRQLVGGEAGEWNSDESIKRRIREAHNSLSTHVNYAGVTAWVFRGNGGQDVTITRDGAPINKTYAKNFINQYFDQNPISSAKTTAQAVIDFFQDMRVNNGEFASVKNKAELIRKYSSFLKGIDPEQYELKFLKQLEGFQESEDSNILVAVHKKTGVMQLIEVATTNNIDLVYNNSSNRNSLFGKYFKNGVFKAHYNFHPIRSNTYSAGLMRLSLISAQLSQQPGFKGVERLIVGSPTKGDGTEEAVETAIPQDMINNLKVFRDIVNSNPDDFTDASLTELLNDENIYDSKQYNNDPLASWYNYIVNRPDIVNNRSKGVREAFVELQDHYKDNFNTYTGDGVVTQETRDLLYDLISRLRMSYSLEDFKKTPHTQLLAKAFLHLKRIPIDAVEDLEVASKHGVTTMQGTQNETIRALSRELTIVKKKRLDLGVTFLSEHQKLVRKLRKEAGVVANPLAYEQTKMLNAMLIDPKQEGEPKNWLKFKPDSELTSTQLKYKKFYVENIKQAFFGHMKDKTKIQPAWDEAIMLGKWDPDWIPTVPADHINKMQENWNSNDMKQLASQVFNSFGRDAKHQTVEDIYAIPPYQITMDTYGGEFNNNRMRQRLFGLDERTNSIEERANTNIEAVLNFLVMKKAEESTNQEMFTVASAIHTAIHMEKEFNHKSTDPLLALINDVVMLSVKRSVDQAKGVQKTVEKLGKGAATSALLFSPSLFVVEATTSVFGTINSSIDNALRSLLGKLFPSTGIKPRYSNKLLWARAGKGITGKDGAKLLAIDRLFGISTGDPEFLKEKLTESRGKSIMSIQKVYEKMSFASKYMRRQMMGAYIDGDGVTNALIYKKETDSVEYDPKKDKRLFIEELVGRPPRNDDEKKQAAFYKALRGELEREGFVKEVGEGDAAYTIITRPYTSMEINRIKEHADVQYGSLDGDEKIVLEKHAIFRAFMVLKKFIIPKIKMYWKGETAKYGGRSGEFIYNEETGQYEMDTTPEEGIIQTMISFSQLLYGMYGFNKNETLRNKEGVLKEFWNSNRTGNMTKLTSDLTMMFIGFLAVSLLAPGEDDDEDSWKHTVGGRALLSGITNATMDYNFAMSLAGTFTGDSFIGLSIFTRSLTNLLGGIFEQDADQVLKGFDSMSGLFRTSHAGVEAALRNM